MSRALSTILVFCALNHAIAFDPDPPPSVITLEWTIAQASRPMKIRFVDATIATILEELDSGMNSPGCYFQIDKSSVRQNLETKLDISADRMSWLQVLAKVADVIDAKILIAPGKFTLVPRANGSEGKNRE